MAAHAAGQTVLSRSSPFFPAGGAVDPSSAPGETIEFAAIRMIGTRTEIDLYDTQGKKNHWIPLGESADGMSVLSYDAHRDQIMAKIGGVNKLLTLRQPHGVSAGHTGFVNSPAMNFAIPTPPPTPDPVATAPASAPVANVVSNVPGVAPASAPAQPTAPLSVARQEEEARMLVSDLLEIGMAQRKAYEEKQKQGANPNAVPVEPAPTPKPDGPPTGG